MTVVKAHMATDPVCGMTVDVHARQADLRRMRGHTYYFCSEGCRTKFAAEPERYPRQDAASRSRCRKARSTPARCIREIVQEGPGHCPICGMALEPMGVPPDEHGGNPELIDFTRRL